jgi:hypothetical protein
MFAFARNPSRLSVLGIAAACRTACNVFTGDRVCTLELRTSLSVNVIDSQSGARIDSGSTVVVLGGAVHDSVTVPAQGNLSFPTAWWYENEVPAGTYSVFVRKTGYTDWTRSGVVIKAGECHVSSPAQLTAAMQRMGS